MKKLNIAAIIVIVLSSVLAAYMLLAERMDDPALHGHGFNFGTAKPLSVLEITERILTLMDRADLQPVVLNEAKAEILHQYLSSDKARRLLGWEPVGSIDGGLSDSIAWYRQHLAAAA